MVQLKEKSPDIYDTLSPLFQFLMVQLKGLSVRLLSAPCRISIPYGSIKRINRCIHVFVIFNISIPYGSIKSLTIPAENEAVFLISIPYGSIKSAGAGNAPIWHIHFNSLWFN